MCNFFDSKAIVSSRKVYQLTILKVGLLVPLKILQLVCPFMYNLKSWQLFLIKPFNTFLRSILCFMIFFTNGGMLIQVLLCCNKSGSHKFIPMLVTYGFNFPICPSISIHLTHVAFCFT